MDSFYRGVVKGIGLDDIGTALGLGAAAYGLHKVNKGIANKLQKSLPKIHNIPKHAISGGLTGALLGGAGGAALAHGLSTIYGKPPVWAVVPIMAGLLGAHGAALGAAGGALKHHIDTTFFNPSKKKKSAKDANLKNKLKYKVLNKFAHTDLYPKLFWDKEGNYSTVKTLKEFAEKGHPENKKITAMAKKFQKEFGNVPMKNWKVSENQRQKTLLPEDKSLHSKYIESINDFSKAWYEDSKKGGWYLP